MHDQSIRDAHGFGQAVRARRLALGLSQAALARDIGVTRQWLIAIERGKSSANLGLVLRLVDALGLQLVLTGVAEPSDPCT